MGFTDSLLLASAGVKPQVGFGAIAALAHTRRERPIPVYFIGVGEGVEDLEAFSAKEFASALLD